MDNLKQTINRYQDAGLTLNKKNCQFSERDIDFHGHAIAENYIATDPKKV